MASEHRIERDSMGEVLVPADAYYGASTERARQTFQISPLRFPRRFLQALGWIKVAAARVNTRLGLLEPELGRAIEMAAREVAEGKFDAQFVVDVFQAGSGTSTNMNANEVIATRAREFLGAERSDRQGCIPMTTLTSARAPTMCFPLPSMWLPWMHSSRKRFQRCANWRRPSRPRRLSTTTCSRQGAHTCRMPCP